MVVGPAAYILGLDLHGTLLEPGEILRPELAPKVADGLSRLRGRALRWLCTGNDLEFVRRKIPAAVLAEIDGYVLETGCSHSADGCEEIVDTTTAERDTITNLELLLRGAGFPEVNYFAHRLTSISMFCDRPAEFSRKVEGFVCGTEFFERVQVTWSSVAVDILPAGYDKHRGLTRAADGRATIGVADSMNDLALLSRSDYSLAPANLAPELRPLLERAGRRIIACGEAAALPTNAVVVAAAKETEGVIELLDWLDRVIQ